MLAALAQDLEGAVATLVVQVADVNTKRLSDTQPVEDEQRRQGVVAGAVPSPAWSRKAPSSLRSRPRVRDS
jgi:hypothetical protein